MRYVAKVYVTDVMDQVVVSGYVFDADSLSNPDHDTTEFTYQVPGVGLDDPLAWLLNSLYRAMVSAQSTAPSAERRGRADGGTHTLSESSDRPQAVVG